VELVLYFHVLTHAIIGAIISYLVLRKEKHNLREGGSIGGFRLEHEVWKELDEKEAQKILGMEQIIGE
jgi:predicted DNA-binding ribbon-helix-helix protein